MKSFSVHSAIPDAEIYPHDPCKRAMLEARCALEEAERWRGLDGVAYSIRRAEARNYHAAMSDAIGWASRNIRRPERINPYAHWTGDDRECDQVWHRQQS